MLLFSLDKGITLARAHGGPAVHGILAGCLADTDLMHRSWNTTTETMVMTCIITALVLS